MDLRYLGSVRTLVLIDGKRMSAGDAVETAPDLNFIPAFLVKRVDVLTGGASSTYGADAVAGVVNFILDKDFEGVRAGVEFGGFEHNNDNKTWDAMNAKKGFTTPTGQAWDGGSLDAYVAMGGKFADGKGSASAYIDYRKTAGLLKNRRDYTNCSGHRSRRDRTGVRRLGHDPGRPVPGLRLRLQLHRRLHAGPVRAGQHVHGRAPAPTCSTTPSTTGCSARTSDGRRAASSTTTGTATSRATSPSC